VPLDESLNRTSIDVPASARPAVRLAGSEGPGLGTGRSTPASGSTATSPGRLRWFSGARSPAGPSSPSPGDQSSCRVDPHDRRILDFQLPGLDGSMVSFRDFDADLILLDFWGSWCTECRKSIAYLRELPGRFDGKRLQVVGIACENGASLAERRASAAEAVRNLAINYPVLVSARDGSCPLLQALKIQFYPTLVLVDRDGRILHVEQGATDATLARIERSLGSALRAAELRPE
jgi:peroxiredoxin